MKSKEWYDLNDRSGYVPGVWDDEPDKKQWLDSETGLPCLIVRNWAGVLCGYVGVSKTHRFYEKGYNQCYLDSPCDEDKWCDHSVDSLIDVHGGLTFSDACSGDPDERSICHLVEPGDDDKVWWLGFDCGHSSDFAPGFRKRIGFMHSGMYRDIAYVEEECRKLAEQLFALRGEEVPNE
jgi:hypothetical protein